MSQIDVAGPGDSLPKTDRSESVKPIDTGRGQPAKTSFGSYMDDAKNRDLSSFGASSAQGGAAAKPLPSVFDLQREQQLSPQAVANQAKNAQNRLRHEVRRPLEETSQRLQQVSPEKRAQIANHPDIHRQLGTLHDTTQSIRQNSINVNDKLAIPSDRGDLHGTNLLEKGLSYVTQAEGNFSKAQARLRELSSDPDRSQNPAEYIALQEQMYQGQQMTEYASILTANVTRAINTMLNVQL